MLSSGRLTITVHIEQDTGLQKNEEALCVLVQSDFQDTLNEKSKVQMLLFGGCLKQNTHTPVHTHTWTCVFVKNVSGKIHKDLEAVSASGDRGPGVQRSEENFTFHHTFRTLNLVPPPGVLN